MNLRSSAWAAPIVGMMQVDPVSTQSAISVGLMITIIGAVAWLSRVLTRNEEQMKGINEKLALLITLPQEVALLKGEVSHVKEHFETMEGDINNLWAAVRETSNDGDLLDRTRRERGPRPSRGTHPKEGR